MKTKWKFAVGDEVLIWEPRHRCHGTKVKIVRQRASESMYDYDITYEGCKFSSGEPILEEHLVRSPALEHPAPSDQHRFEVGDSVLHEGVVKKVTSRAGPYYSLADASGQERWSVHDSLLAIVPKFKKGDLVLHNLIERRVSFVASGMHVVFYTVTDLDGKPAVGGIAEKDLLPLSPRKFKEGDRVVVHSPYLQGFHGKVATIVKPQGFRTDTQTEPWYVIDFGPTTLATEQVYSAAESYLTPVSEEDSKLRFKPGDIVRVKSEEGLVRILEADRRKKLGAFFDYAVERLNGTRQRETQLHMDDELEPATEEEKAAHVEITSVSTPTTPAAIPPTPEKPIAKKERPKEKVLRMFCKQHPTREGRHYEGLEDEYRCFECARSFLAERERTDPILRKIYGHEERDEIAWFRKRLVSAAKWAGRVVVVAGAAVGGLGVGYLLQLAID